MTAGVKPIRRVVTGHDSQGRSTVTWDGPAPNVHQTSMSAGRGHTDIWVWPDTPAPLSGDRDDGFMEYDAPGPPEGGHVRIVQAQPRLPDYDPANDPEIVSSHPTRVRPSGRAWDRGDKSVFLSGMHKTQSVDYGIVLEGERGLTLDEGEAVLTPGDVVVQVGSWHQWDSGRIGCVMAFNMISADFVDYPAGLVQGSDPVIISDPAHRLPDGVKPTRRVVTADVAQDKSVLVSDGPSPDMHFDPARPGFASSRLWVTDTTPAKLAFETLHLPHTIEPPPRGSVCRVITIPPDDVWRGKVGAAEVTAYFAAMGSPSASTYSGEAPHPYMQKTASLDLCFVIEGEIVLVLDTTEVPLKAGDIVVQRGTNHAWSNRSTSPCVIAINSHDGKY